MLSKSDRNEHLIKEYFRKISCNFLQVNDLSKEIKLDYLQKVYNCHMQSYPFHNFELRVASQSHPLFRQSLTLFNLGEFIDGYNGGFCFQSSEILYRALSKSGFEVYRSIAKVLNGLSPDSLEAKKIPATHLILIVTIENEKYLVDPTMGMNGSCSPFLIPENEHVYQQNNQHYKIEKVKEEYHFYRKIKENWSISFCSSFLPANQTTISTQLTKLGCYPLTLGIRDLIGLVGIATPTGGKSLLWNPKTRLFIFKTICYIEGDKEQSFNDLGVAYELICNQFKIDHISKKKFKQFCEKNKWPQLKSSFFVDFPIDKNEIEKMKENFSNCENKYI
ncbi:arylamine N-acetyltransferase [Legionella sp. WA2024007413]